MGIEMLANTRACLKLEENTEIKYVSRKSCMKLQQTRHYEGRDIRK